MTLRESTRSRRGPPGARTQRASAARALAADGMGRGAQTERALASGWSESRPHERSTRQGGDGHGRVSRLAGRPSLAVAGYGLETDARSAGRSCNAYWGRVRESCMGPTGKGIRAWPDRSELN